MDRHVHHARILLKNLLSSVAVMHIPVKYQYPFSPSSLHVNTVKCEHPMSNKSDTVALITQLNAYHQVILTSGCMQTGNRDKLLHEWQELQR